MQSAETVNILSQNIPDCSIFPDSKIHLETSTCVQRVTKDFHNCMNKLQPNPARSS